MAGILANSASQTMVSGDTAVSKTVSGYLSQEQITLTAFPTGSTYAWAQSIPSGSAGARAALSSSTAASVRFSPDVAGTYVLTCVVDSATTYTMIISVVQASVTTSLEAIRYAPVTAVSVIAPAQGQATFYDVDASRLRAKNSDATITDIGPRVGSVTLSSGTQTIVDASIGTATHVALTLTTASDLGTVSVGVVAGTATLTSTDGADASTFSYALLG